MYRKSHIYILICILFVWAVSLNAATYTVGHETENDFQTITDSLLVASAGDTILVKTGMYKATDPLYPETFPLIMKSGVTLKRMSDDAVPAINAEQTTYVIHCEDLALGSTIEGFLILGGYVDFNDPQIHGGGCLIANSDLSIVDCQFIGNSAFEGGGIHAVNSTVQIKDTFFNANNSDADGGGVSVQNSQVTIDHCVFSENTAAWGGGGVNLVGGTDFVMINSILLGNTAGGGGGFQADSSLPTTEVLNCLFANNIAQNDGGAVKLTTNLDDRNFVFSNCTFADNTAVSGTGGGIDFSTNSPSTLKHCIVWNNSPEQFAGELAIVSASYCNIQDGFPGRSNINADPLFVTGPAGDYYLSQTISGQGADSPCVNTGSDLASNITYSVGGTTYTMGKMTTRTDIVFDTGQADMGYHDLEATAPECTVLGCTIEMPSNDFGAGDTCYCNVHVCNPSQTTYSDTPVFVILDILGMFYFAPSFGEFDRYLYDVVPGKITIEVLPVFTWPAGAGAISNIYWYAAMTNPDMTDLFGAMDSMTFGWH